MIFLQHQEHFEQNINLDVGQYVNLFEVLNLPTEEITVVATDRGSYPDLRSLRADIATVAKEAWLCADGNLVYGYGTDIDFLRTKGFTNREVRLSMVHA